MSASGFLWQCRVSRAIPSNHKKKILLQNSLTISPFVDSAPPAFPFFSTNYSTESDRFRRDYFPVSESIISVIFHPGDACFSPFHAANRLKCQKPANEFTKN
ncbi:hypothetical protein U9K49_04535 [Pantoea agglomerans]|uniref:hypothetical protein n=1 Tax=Enterobacter agglomerans TaxID=549 RepID=UPI002D79B4BF|nr:hypothetical protein [Pantoea agglomerans]WRO91041.1 hypothetical protein U9K49_04535 [Pantoea agglomerans]